MPNILNDDRFKAMFEDPAFQVDEKSEEFRLLNPLVSKISQKRKKKLKEMAELQVKEQVQYKDFFFILYLTQMPDFTSLFVLG